MPLRVTVDRKACLACGAAPNICPEVFVLDGKNRVVDKYSVSLTDTLSVGEVPDELSECVKKAAEACPVSAIEVQS